LPGLGDALADLAHRLASDARCLGGSWAASGYIGNPARDPSGNTISSLITEKYSPARWSQTIGRLPAITSTLRS
jgi:hypothetical protein